jgi:hypothetical protein
MQTTTVIRQSPIDLLCEAIDALEATASPTSAPARFALTALVDVIDQAFQASLGLAGGCDVRDREAQVPFLFVTGKLLEVSRFLALPEDSPASRCLALIEWEE